MPGANIYFEGTFEGTTSDTSGNYNLTIESSGDSVTWTPIHSQAIQSDTTSRLFRVRIAKLD